AGESGNLFVHTRRGFGKVNELLNASGEFWVPSVTVTLSLGDKIEIADMASVTFTPAKRKLHTTLSTGYWEVGLDIPPGRYKATPKSGESDESGNLFVSSRIRTVKVNEILGHKGKYEVPSVTVTLEDGDLIQVSSLSAVKFTSI